MRHRKLAVWAVVVAGAVAAASARAEICIKRSRAVVFRQTACKRHEKALDGAQLGGVQGVKGPKGPTGAVGGPSIVNAAGQRIGTLSLDAGVEALFLRSPIDDSIVECLGANVDGCRRAADVTLLHEGTQCLGQAFRNATAADLVRNAAYRDGRLFLTGDPVDAQPRHYESRENFSDDPCDNGGFITPAGSCCRNIATDTTAGPAHIVDFAATYGNPPFQVQP